MKVKELRGFLSADMISINTNKDNHLFETEIDCPTNNYIEYDFNGLDNPRSMWSLYGEKEIEQIYPYNDELNIDIEE